ncbi:MAG: 2,3-dihydro-2,3-dihydroxybenzoate dehydrogenase [Lautropia sp.]|nr:2,3-dihydro-2,3-dihydroxybenzoate dehydrogenase [Lautropia sp.]
MTANTPRRFENRKVLITGAASGIGRRAAECFVAEGASVVGLDAIAPTEKTDFQVLPLDITQAADVEKTCATLKAEGFVPDVIVNAAGTLRLGRTDTLSVDDWQHCINVNVTGPFLLLRQWVKEMKARRSGAIVNIASNAAHVPRLDMAAYCTSKAALVSFSHCVALEMAPFGVRCNVVSPGSTRTPMLTGMQGGNLDDTPFIQGTPQNYKLGIPLAKVAQPDDIARVVLFLASDDANHVTMQDVVVDGGATLGA